MKHLPCKEKLLLNFDRCIQWEEKYLYIMQLGKQLPHNSKDLYQDINIIYGCQSQVWMRMFEKENSIINFEGDSDSAIVKGLLAVVFVLYQGLSAREIIQFDIKHWLGKLCLNKHLTMSRSQGLEAILRTIRSNAMQFIL